MVGRHGDPRSVIQHYVQRRNSRGSDSQYIHAMAMVATELAPNCFLDSVGLARRHRADDENMVTTATAFGTATWGFLLCKYFHSTGLGELWRGLGVCHERGLLHTQLH